MFNFLYKKYFTKIFSLFSLFSFFLFSFFFCSERRCQPHVCQSNQSGYPPSGFPIGDLLQSKNFSKEGKKKEKKKEIFVHGFLVVCKLKTRKTSKNSQKRRLAKKKKKKKFEKQHICNFEKFFFQHSNRIQAEGTIFLRQGT